MPRKTVMCIYNLAPRRIGGIETMVRELAVQLDPLGWNAVLCFRTAPTLEVAEFLSTPNVELDVLPQTSRTSLRSAVGFSRLMARHRPAIVHFNFFDFLSPFAWLARRGGARKVVFTDHISRAENDASGRSSWLKRTAYRSVVPIENVICVSEYIRRCWLDSDAIPADQLATVYNGVDSDRCQAALANGPAFRNRYGIAHDKLLVTQVASMIPEKGFMTLLQAIPAVLRARQDVHFVVAGDGQERDGYEQFAHREGFSHHITFTGLVKDPIADGLFAASDVVCQVSNWNEAFGLVIAEAIGSGKPVIGTSVGGIPELVRDGETGYLIARRDSAALAERILRLAADANLRSQMGQAALAAFAEQFDVRRNASRTIEIYNLASLAV